MTAAKSAPGHGPKLTVVEGSQAGSPGQKLMRARSQRGLALEDVARQLNLSVSMVKAMEADNFKNLPGRAFVKGYLRNYAKLVAIDAEELVRAYESQFAGSEEPSLNPPSISRPPRWIAPLIRSVGVLLLIAVVAGIGNVVYQNFGVLADKAQQLTSTLATDESTTPDEPAPAAPAEQPASQANTVNLNIPLRPVEGVTPSTAEGGALPAAPASPATADSPVASPADSSMPRDPANVPPQSALGADVTVAASAAHAAPAPAAPAANSSPGAVTPAADAASADAVGAAVVAGEAASSSPQVNGNAETASVSLVFSGLSWARVRDANDRVLFDGTRANGTQVDLQGKAPFNIRLGNAPVVKVTFNGEPRAFDFSSSSNVAQFTLGDE